MRFLAAKDAKSAKGMGKEGGNRKREGGRYPPTTEGRSCRNSPAP